jgi:hypothetical protein
MAGSTDPVTLFCLGTGPGQRRLLSGLTRGDHGVEMREFQDLEAHTTSWARTQSASGRTWTLRCMGDPPPGVERSNLFLFGGSSGGVIITPASPDEKIQTWRARPVRGGFTLENVALRNAKIAARFLDGRTQDGSVGLAPNTDPPFTGTHWSVTPITGAGPFVQ